MRRARWSYTMMLLASGVVFTISTLATATHPGDTRPAEAQLPPCAPPLEPPLCIEGGIGAGEVLDPILDPVIAQLSQAVTQLTTGALDTIAAQIAIAAVASLNVLWVTINEHTTPDLDAVEDIHSIFVAVGGSLIVTMVTASMFPAMARFDFTRGFDALARGIAAAVGIASTRWFLDLLIPATDALADTLVLGANQDLGQWIDELSPGVLASVNSQTATGAAWPILLFAAVVFLAGVIGIVIILIGAMYGYLGLYLMSPILWALTIHPWTRNIATNALRKFFSLLLMKIAIASGIALVVAVLTFTPSGTATDAIISFLIGGVGFIALWATPWVLLTIFGLDIQTTTTTNTSTIGRNALKPAETARAVVGTGVAIAGVATARTSFGPWLRSQSTAGPSVAGRATKVVDAARARPASRLESKPRPPDP